MIIKNKFFIGSVLLVSMTLALREIYNNFSEDKIVNISDSVRISKGIPPIEDSWIVAESTEDYVIWGTKNPMLNSIEPLHYYKEQSLINDKVALEKDVFHYETDSTIAYRLICKYNFNTDSTHFEFIKYFKGKYPPTVTIIVNKDFADSIFTNWGIKKFY